MDANDLARFCDWFDILAVTHSKPFPNEDIRSRAKSEYFDVLRPYPIENVSSAYESLRRKMKKWPVPADWLEALPPNGTTGLLPALTDEEVAQNDEAERLGYEAKALCHCDFCEREGATHLYPRYVPRLDRHGNIIERRHPQRPGRAILLGRWLHGAELKRWYSARANFYALKDQIFAAMQAERQRGPDARMLRLVTEASAVKAEVSA